MIKLIFKFIKIIIPKNIIIKIAKITTPQDP